MRKRRNTAPEFNTPDPNALPGMMSMETHFSTNKPFRTPGPHLEWILAPDTELKLALEYLKVSCKAKLYL